MMNPMRLSFNRLLAGLCLFVLPVTFLGCASRTPVAAPPLAEVAFPTMEREPYRLQVGDQIGIKFWGNPELDQNIVIRPDGVISMPFVDEVEAVGLTPAELKSVLIQLYKAELATPDITVIVQGVVGQDIFFGGEINRPGSLPLQGGLTLYQAILAAGGFTAEARRDSVIVIRTTAAGERIAAKVNMMPIASAKDLQTDFVMQASDIIFVPRARILDFTDFLTRYFYDILPIRVVGTVRLFDNNNNNTTVVDPGTG